MREVINICVKIYFAHKPCHFCWGLLLVEIISFWFVLLERTNLHVCEKTVELKHRSFIYSSAVLWNRHLVLLGSRHATSVAAIYFLATKEKQLDGYSVEKPKAIPLLALYVFLNSSREWKWRNCIFPTSNIFVPRLLLDVLQSVSLSFASPNNTGQNAARFVKVLQSF